MVRKFLFQLHLWLGLILGVVFVLIGLSGSIDTLEPLVYAPPVVQVTAARTPALNKGLAAARAAVRAPQSVGATINLPSGSHDPVVIHFDGQMPAVATDPSTGKVLATFSAEAPDWFTAIVQFHNGFLMGRIGRTVEGWLGLIMIFMGLTGLYLWWPKAGRWKYAFIVRRSAKGLRFQRELHGAAGIWMLAVYLLVTTSGLDLCFSQAETLITFVTGGAEPRFSGPPIVTASEQTTLIGPDEALAVVGKARDLRGLLLRVPGWTPGQPALLPIIAQPVSGMPIYLDPYNGASIPNPDPPPNTHYKVRLALFHLHTGINMGPVYAVLVFISGLMPLVFFATGLIMWLKKRQNRLAMLQPLPESIMEQQVS